MRVSPAELHRVVAEIARAFARAAPSVDTSAVLGARVALRPAAAALDGVRQAVPAPAATLRALEREVSAWRGYTLQYAHLASEHQAAAVAKLVSA